MYGSDCRKVLHTFSGRLRKHATDFRLRLVRRSFAGDCTGSHPHQALSLYTTSAMSKRTAAAAAAAHAASKRNSVIELNAGSEERARQALQV